MTDTEYHPYDRSSKWIIRHHGDSILWLAKIRNIERWRPTPAEVVQPRQLPDGLLDVRLVGEPVDDSFLLEVATYPERRVTEQLTRDTMLTYLARNELPESVVLVLAPKGKYRIPGSRRMRSRRGLTSCTVKWHVIELWNVPAADLLAAGDIGLIPWVMLADSPETPEALAHRCRDAIEQNAPPGEKENLLAVVQVLARLRYNDPNVLSILGGRKIMIESPLIQEIVSEAQQGTKQEAILECLAFRFGELPEELNSRLRTLTEFDVLTELMRVAATCNSLDEFRSALNHD